MLMRNFTISSSAQPPTVFDFQYLDRRVLLGDGATEVVFSVENITLANVRYEAAVAAATVLQCRRIASQLAAQSASSTQRSRQQARC